MSDHANDPAAGNGSGNGNGAGTAVTLTRKDFQSDQEVRWCPGCGDYSILAAVQLMMPDLGVRRGSAAVAVALVLVGLGTALGGYRRWQRNERAIGADRPLPESRFLPIVVAALVAVLAVVAVLVGVQVLTR